jgi:hypothetical protein
MITTRQLTEFMHGDLSYGMMREYISQLSALEVMQLRSLVANYDMNMGLNRTEPQRTRLQSLYDLVAAQFISTSGMVGIGQANVQDPQQEESEKSNLESFLRKTLKKRHLSKAEREGFNKPNSDWILKGAKEVCKAAHALPIEDIITKEKCLTRD